MTTRPLRILHVITNLQTGGAEKLMVDLLPAFRDKGFQVELAIFDGADTPFLQALERQGIKIHKFSIGGSVYSPVHILRLRRLMRNFDIVHTHNTSPQYFAALAALGTHKRLVTTEHNTFNRRRSYKIFKLIDSFIYKKYSYVICISDAAKDSLENFIGRNKTVIQTIYNGVNTDFFIEAENKESLQRDEKRILMVAAFRQQKDQPTLIRALTHLPSEFHLYLAGDGEFRPSCEALARDLSISDRTHFLGLRSDIPSLLHKSDYVVMSSHYEGLSLSSVEGMCSGSPFIASDVNGLREVVAGHGILFPEGDDCALANIILDLDSDPQKYSDIANRCICRAREFDISRMIDAYSNLYLSL